MVKSRVLIIEPGSKSSLTGAVCTDHNKNVAPKHKFVFGWVLLRGRQLNRFGFSFWHAMKLTIIDVIAMERFEYILALVAQRIMALTMDAEETNSDNGAPYIIESRVCG